MNTEEYRKLVYEQARKSGADPDVALREFIEAVRQMTLARADSERIYEQLQELGRQYAWYRKGEPYKGPRLLDETELGRLYAETKARQRATNKLLSIRCNRANALLGSGTYFRHGRPVPAPRDSSAGSATPPLHQKSELVILTDPDDGEPIILEMFGQ